MLWQDARDVFQMLNACDNYPQQLEAAKRFCEQWKEKQARYLASRRRQQHHKLTPDPRYKRDRLWKHRLEE